MASDNWDFFNLEDAGINCMAMYNSKIYFLLPGVYGNYGQYQGYIVKLELRLLDGCEDKWSKNTEAGLNILKCSKLIANVTEDSESKINWEKRTFSVKGSYMKIIKDPNTDILLFFFQVWKFKGQKIFLELYQASEKGLVSLLHTEEQSEESPVRTMGIDYKNGTICWSTSFSLKCAELRNGALSNFRSILDKSDIRKVCKINATPSEYVTGVAITKRSNHAVNVYFGCQGNIAHEGGLGMVIQGTSIADSRHEIFNVTSRGKKVLGGILFTTETLPVTCATVVNYPNDGRKTSEGQKPVKSGTMITYQTFNTVELKILGTFIYILFNINVFY
ncbi:unnamed protein product [Owenia fusiformis]|uniref:Uncharacterized protein n=1 Tax=Owenia fusiformis TaxID=6347 RepID=A0A8S4P9I6_OWEFU|nr:unnamed protein product [Owenia fusiformis]